MTNTNESLPSQPTDLVARFEPARAVCAPKACDRREGCWVITAKIRGDVMPSTRCTACNGTIQIPGNEAKHMAVLRRCMAAQNEVTR